MQSFLASWNARYPETPPIGYLFKRRMPERWVRIHSLPEARRYAKSPEDWTELLHRHNTVTSHLIAPGTEISVIVNAIEIGNPLFKSCDFENIGVFVQDDCTFQSFRFHTQWQPGALDELFRMTANDEGRAFLIGPDCLVAPYDGGIDVILPDVTARRAFKAHFKDWLSPREDGL